MNSSSQRKIIKAGFMIIRKDDYPQARIKFLDKETYSWKTHKKYATKSSRDKDFDDMLKDLKIIED